MDSTPVVSVLVTVYNRARYLEACLESIRESTYPHWEAVVVDDGSSDESLMIARQFAAVDPRFRVFCNEANLGDYPNRNRAASLALGKYLKYLDADDMLYPHALGIFVEEMERFPQAALGISQQVVEDVLPYPFLMTPHETYRREFLCRGVLGVGPTGTIIRRDCFEALGGFSIQRHIGDTDMWLRLSAQYPVLKLNACLTFWRRHEGQEIVAEDRNLSVRRVRYDHLLQMLRSEHCPLNESERTEAMRRVHRRYARFLVRLALKNGPLGETSRLSKGMGGWMKILRYAWT